MAGRYAGKPVPKPTACTKSVQASQGTWPAKAPSACAKCPRWAFGTSQPSPSAQAKGPEALGVHRPWRLVRAPVRLQVPRPAGAKCPGLALGASRPWRLEVGWFASELVHLQAPRQGSQAVGLGAGRPRMEATTKGEGCWIKEKT
ncbi:hypothetical protein SELMODRAFT_409971 [Selaginella moellendorffii]|uniref:Uncharacterized protein n=1 Tax=Selaginella moellendorffii TaxID=88036 RepID=D8RD21_SELML|nr:hypothetical protein SELMODRAFT_409971 [Selaginella moellendorffii]